MEAKKNEGVLSCRGAPPVPDGRCMVIEWTDATRAVETSMGDWKKGGQWGEWAPAGCQIRKGRSCWHVREAGDGARGTHWYLPGS